MPLETLRARLAKAKDKASKNNYATIDGVFKPAADWRDHARGRWHVASAGVWQRLEDMPRHANASDRAYYCDKWPDGLRYVNSAYDVSRAEHSRRVDHTGWYTDSFQDGTLSGHVLQLPGHDGKPIYIPGTAHSDWDGITLYPLNMFDDALECAQAADSYAEHAAESEREYQAKDQAKQQIAELHEEIVTLRADARALIREMKTARNTASTYPVICKALRDKLADIREESRKAYERITKLQNNYWYAVES